MIRQKYALETSLQITNTYSHLLQLEDLATSAALRQESGARFNIYLILERDRLTAVPEGFSIHDGFVHLRVLRHTSGSPVASDLRIRALFDTDGVVIESPYPYTRYVLRKGGETLGDGKLAALLAYQPDVAPELVRHDVVYVGQAQGGGRDAVSRLAAHETLQKIQHDVMTHRPHREVWLLLLDIEPSTISVMTGGAGAAPIGVDESLRRQAAIEEAADRDRELLVNVAEAGLIRYFQPTYNHHFKATFPDRIHKSYKAVYDLDVNSIEIVVATHQIGIHLAAETVKPTVVHVLSYQIRAGADGDYLLADFRAPINDVSQQK